MPLIRYTDHRFSAATRAIIDHANEIIAEYTAQGFDLTLRQLYYQFVSRDLIANNQREYKRLGDIIGNARLAGLVDWDHITDRTRNLRSVSHWGTPGDIVSACAEQFRHDKWRDQRYRPEVWIEKDALVGVFEGVCRELDVAYFSCRGYTSLSEVWSAGRRLREYRRAGQVPIVLHFGDHDPSGLDMTRDIRERLAMFAEGRIEVRRLALNRDQIDEYDPPPNPAKMSDSRAENYVEQHGEESWELDALDPVTLADLVRTEVENLRDENAWGRAVNREQEARRQLAHVSARWGEIVDGLEIPEDDHEPDDEEPDEDDED